MTTFFTSRGSGECKLAHLKSLLFYLKGPPRVSGFTLFSQSDTTHIDGHTLVTIPRFTMQNHFISSSPIRQKGNNYCAKGLTRSRLSHYIHFFWFISTPHDKTCLHQKTCFFKKHIAFNIQNRTDMVE